MALTYSSMLELGSNLKEFNLLNTVNGNNFSSSELDEIKPSLIMFVCNHCPYVIHYHDEIKRLADDYGEILNMVAISSNDVKNYPQDGPDQMKELFLNLGLSFPYLFDETQDIAKVLRAECTPEFYLYDNNDMLVYRGRMDNSSPGNDIEVSGSDLRNACSNLLRGVQIPSNQHPSMGCNIKWK